MNNYQEDNNNHPLITKNNQSKPSVVGGMHNFVSQESIGSTNNSKISTLTGINKRFFSFSSNSAHYASQNEGNKSNKAAPKFVKPHDSNRFYYYEADFEADFEKGFPCKKWLSTSKYGGPSSSSNFKRFYSSVNAAKPSYDNDCEAGKTRFASQDLIEDKKLKNNIFLKRAIYNFIKASVNNKISGVHFQDSTALITFLREFDPDFNMSRQSVHNFRKRKVVFKGFLVNTDVSRFFAYVKSRFPEFNLSAFLENYSGTSKPNNFWIKAGGLLKFGDVVARNWAGSSSGFLPLRSDIPRGEAAQKSTRYYSKKANNKKSVGGFTPDKDSLNGDEAAELGKVYKKGFVATFFNFEEFIKKVKLELKPEWNKNGAPTYHYLRLIKKKPGIYMFTNNITKHRFIGKSSNLLETFLNYHSDKASFSKKNKNSKIKEAMRKHGYPNFSISILEYCNYSELKSKKHYYINVLKPQYNQ